MHIGFLTPEYPEVSDSGSGGLGTSIKNLAESLTKEGVKVTIFIYGQSKTKVFMHGGMFIHTIKQKKYKTLGWFLYRKHLQSYINHEIKKEHINLLEAPDWTGITALMNFDCPLVVRLNGSDAYFCYLEGRKQKPKNRFFEKRALGSADYIVSVSAFTAELTRTIFALKPSIPVIPNSIDIKKFSASKTAIFKNQLLYFGSLIRKKGVLELSYIFNEIVKQKDGIKLLLIGKDVVDTFEKKSTLKLFMNRLHPEARKRVEHIPEVRYDDIKDYISSSEIIILPSFAEALPMTWIEAMAMEKALVTSDIGWAREVMINGETGFTVDPKNHKEFAGKVLQILNDTNLKVEMGKKARRRVEEIFSSNVVAKKNIDFYNSVINRCKTGELEDGYSDKNL